VERGTVAVGDRVSLLELGAPGMVTSGDEYEDARVSKLYTFSGLERIDVEEAVAGDIVALAGIEGVEIGKTLTDPEHRERLRGIAVEEPTLSVDFTVNNSPFAGQSGKFVTTRQVRERLYKELERNVALRVEDTDQPDTFTVNGRGELHLTILMETMRREGFELTVGRPRVVMRTDEATGQRLEPVEEVIIDVDEEFSGAVVQKLSERRAELKDMRPSGAGRQRLVFHAPTRGLIGYQGELLTDTRGTAIMNRLFHAYAPHMSSIPSRHTGVLLSNGEGEAVAYALWKLEDRGPMFIEPGTKVYAGMIVGEHTRGNDLEINVLKAKQLTNIRAAGSDENILLTPAVRFSLEQALEFIDDDELVEVTPKGIRLRKKLLTESERKRDSRLRA